MPYNTQGYQQNYQPSQTKAEEAMDWDETINGDDARSFEILPEGDYRFTVTQFIRARYEGGEKIPPCNKAVLTLALQSAWEPTAENPAVEGTVNTNLFLVRSQRWKITQFFISIGFLKPGEEKAMNWGIVPGSSGLCAVSQRKWTGNDGKEHTGNDIARFYDPDNMPDVPKAAPAAKPPVQNAQPSSAANTWVKGKF